jgi:hypothetical protein
MPSEILPLPKEDAANMAYLTSLFRYRVLAEQGGIWADMDVVALEDDPASRPARSSHPRSAALPPCGTHRHGREPHPGDELLHGESGA